MFIGVRTQPTGRTVLLLVLKLTAYYSVLFYAGETARLTQIICFDLIVRNEE